jgi:hypothetical protein
MRPSPKKLRALADQLDAAPPEHFISWADGVPHYSPLLDQWTHAARSLGALRGSPVYGDILEGKHPRPTARAIATADKRSLIGYATYLFRGEKFCYGFHAGCHADGSLSAVLRRFADLKAKSWFS